MGLKRASYKDGVDFIAWNDNCDMNAVDELVGTCSVLMLAELFGTTQERVAQDVVNYRVKKGIIERAKS